MFASLELLVEFNAVRSVEVRNHMLSTVNVRGTDGAVFVVSSLDCCQTSHAQVCMLKHINMQV